MKPLSEEEIKVMVASCQLPASRTIMQAIETGRFILAWATARAKKEKAEFKHEPGDGIPPPSILWNDDDWLDAVLERIGWEEQHK